YQYNIVLGLQEWCAVFTPRISFEHVVTKPPRIFNYYYYSLQRAQSDAA
uniref:Uncharacterized protein n=1 Tax=Anopheles minimus TaxID=112268 RepID=A0A182WMX5_9DIPT